MMHSTRNIIVAVIGLKTVTCKTIRTSNGRYSLDGNKWSAIFQDYIYRSISHFIFHRDSNSTFLENLIQSEDLYLLYIFGLVCLIGLIWLLLKLYCMNNSKSKDFKRVAESKIHKVKQLKINHSSKFKELSESTAYEKEEKISCFCVIFIMLFLCALFLSPGR